MDETPMPLDQAEAKQAMDQQEEYRVLTSTL